MVTSEYVAASVFFRRAFIIARREETRDGPRARRASRKTGLQCEVALLLLATPRLPPVGWLELDLSETRSRLVSWLVRLVFRR